MTRCEVEFKGRSVGQSFTLPLGVEDGSGSEERERRERLGSRLMELPLEMQEIKSVETKNPTMFFVKAWVG